MMWLMPAYVAKYRIYVRLDMQCVNPVRIIKAGKSRKDQQFNMKYPDGLLVPCGKCVGCRIKKRKEWQMRMIHELLYHEDSIFITLTYDNDNVPPNGSLRLDHLQKFFKRLRRRLDDDNNKRRIKYFACGEYGDRSGRPHYHAIIFGMSLSPEDKGRIMESWPYADWSIPAIRQNSFGLAEPDSIAYVSQYINKKLSGPAEARQLEEGKENVFRLLSLGIGRRYAEEYAGQMIANGNITVRGFKNSIPRYYLEKCRVLIDTRLFEEKMKEINYYNDCEKTEEFIGINIDDKSAYRKLKASDYRVKNELELLQNAQININKLAKINLKQKKL